MTLGDLIIIVTIILGTIPVGKLLWKSYGRRQVSSVPAPLPPVVMSPSRLSAPSDPSVLKTDTIKEEPAPPPVVVVRSVSLDTCKLMRSYGLTRDQARVVAKSMDHTLDNNVWAKAAPVQEEGDDLAVNPWSGRQTKRSYYPDEPTLEYKELEA